jgi:vacuolar-type H+-ATPase subunit E/Vma4
MSKTQKVLKTGEATPTIAVTEKKVEKKTTTIASIAQSRLARLEKREKNLTVAIEKFQTALVKVKAQKEAELKAIQELTATFSNTPKA